MSGRRSMMNRLLRQRVVATAAIHRWATSHDDRHTWLVECLTRHSGHDWGDLDEYDAAANTAAIDARRVRVISTYPVPTWLATIDTADDHVWIITDDVADASSPVTILWPSDY